MNLSTDVSDMWDRGGDVDGPRKVIEEIGEGGDCLLARAFGKRRGNRLLKVAVLARLSSVERGKSWWTTGGRVTMHQITNLKKVIHKPGKGDSFESDNQTSWIVALRTCHFRVGPTHQSFTAAPAESILGQGGQGRRYVFNFGATSFDHPDSAFWSQLLRLNSYLERIQLLQKSFSAELQFLETKAAQGLSWNSAKMPQGTMALATQSACRFGVCHECVRRFCTYHNPQCGIWVNQVCCFDAAGKCAKKKQCMCSITVWQENLLVFKETKLRNHAFTTTLIFSHKRTNNHCLIFISLLCNGLFCASCYCRMNRDTKARGVVKIKHDLSTSQLLVIFVQKLSFSKTTFVWPLATAMTAQSLLDMCFGGEPAATPNWPLGMFGSFWISGIFCAPAWFKTRWNELLWMVFLDLGQASNFPAFGRPTKHFREAVGSLDIGLATENHGKITWEKVDTIGKHVRNLVGFAILFGTIDGFVWFRTWKPQLSPHVQAKSFPFSSQYPSLVCSKLTF